MLSLLSTDIRDLVRLWGWFSQAQRELRNREAAIMKDYFERKIARLKTTP